MEIYRYKVVCWDECKKDEFTTYGIVAGETPEDAFQKVYRNYFDILMTVAIEFDEPNGGIKEMGLEEVKDVWEHMGEF